MHNALICYQFLMYSKEFTVESQVIFVALSMHVRKEVCIQKLAMLIEHLRIKS